MTVLVAGNAAHLDLSFRAARRPGPSEVGLLTGGPGTRGRWLAGGAARTVALAVHAEGLPVRLWYPHPLDVPDAPDLQPLRIAGIDLSQLPASDSEVGRCILVDSPEGRQAWSTPPSAAMPECLPALFAGVTHLVIAPAWGAWALSLLKEADRLQIPCSVVGETAPGISERAWHVAVVDEAQNQRHPVRAATLVLTRGAAGAAVRHLGKVYEIPAVETRVVDTTGAGDVFGGTFLARLLRGDAADVAATAAAAAASRTCEGWGAWSGFSCAAAVAPGRTRADRVRGALAGTACGDAFGMPNSFLRAPVWRTVMEPGPTDSPYHAGYPAGRITDDTEQALALTEALEEGFTAAVVARHLNHWFVSVGGENSLAVGPSTRRALMAYQNGATVEQIGVAGVTNGAAMRISPIGVYGALTGLGLEELADLVAVACLPTHATSPANSGACALASAIAAAVEGAGWEQVMAAAEAGAKAGERRGKWIYAADVGARIRLARRLAAGARSRAEMATVVSQIIGAGEPSTESVPAAIAIADFAQGDPRLAIEIAGNLRGDTDTVAAMAGAVCGAYAGEEAIPREWRDLVEQINTLDINRWGEKLEQAAHKQSEGKAR